MVLIVNFWRYTKVILKVKHAFKEIKNIIVENHSIKGVEDVFIPHFIALPQDNAKLEYMIEMSKCSL